MADSLLEEVYNHIAFPRDLPGKQDRSPEQVQKALVDRMLSTVRDFLTMVAPDNYNVLETLRRSISTCKLLHSTGAVDKQSLLREFQALDGNLTLIIFIAAQNVGLLVYRCGDRVVFEAFEASPLSTEVMETKDALQWDFPGRAVSLRYQDFDNASLQKTLADFLDKANEPVKKYTAKAQKAGAEVYECRETTNPALITGMLFEVLEGWGSSASVAPLRKRIRDNVSWKNAEIPWRRSPAYLVLRVALQRHLTRNLKGDGGRIYYKFIMALFMARFLQEAYSLVQVEASHFLKAKLCLRLSKLEEERSSATGISRAMYERLFSCLGRAIRPSLLAATRYIEEQWSAFRNESLRRVSLLPRRAAPEDFRLQLPNCGRYLDQIVSQPLAGFRTSQQQRASEMLHAFQQSVSANKPLMEFAHRYTALADMEMQDKDFLVEPFGSSHESKPYCVALGRRIIHLISEVGQSYDEYMEAKSAFLLHLMEFWVAMDKHAVRCFPLLKDFRPPFPPEILDELYLLSLHDMRRLYSVQAYLSKRDQECTTTRKTIFHDPAEDSFAVKYFDSYDDGSLARLRSEIEEDAEAAHADKQEEWRLESKRYDDMKTQRAESSCLYTLDRETYEEVHDQKRCTKCYLFRVMRRMRFQPYERPLPDNLNELKAALFELDIPQSFAAYRESTFRILSRFAYTEDPASLMEPKVMVRNYSGLSQYVNKSQTGLSLGSTKKLFEQTHYQSVPFPVEEAEIFRPCGLVLKYYDMESAMWTSKNASIKPSFSQQFLFKIPKNSPFACLHTEANGRSSGSISQPPSSYQIVASQPRCPKNLNLHEFMAYQSLLSTANNTPWLTLLRELASSNLNLSTEATLALVTRITLQAGPSSGASILRAVHLVFDDPSFCDRLTEVLKQRIEGIKTNWREPICMELLLTVALRLTCLASARQCRRDASNLVLRIRWITYEWILGLREELHSATEAATSQRLTSYSIRAALLCKRTFCLSQSVIAPDDLKVFVSASIALQDNLAGNIKDLPSSMRSGLLRDLRIVHGMKQQLRQSIEASHDGLMATIYSVWPVPEDYASCSTHVEFLSMSQEGWLKVEMLASTGYMNRIIHYNYLWGHLLVDGKPLGKLPVEYRKSPLLQCLFPSADLFTYPSNLSGMDYVVSLSMPYGYSLHVGSRASYVVTRALHRQSGHIFEFVPAHLFGNADFFDIPLSLVNGCTHWLDLRTGELEIRHGTTPAEVFKSKPSNWRLNLRTREARRRDSLLISPQSRLFGRVAKIFRLFEMPAHLTVYQPKVRNLSVEIRRMELSWFVNYKGLLESSELGEIGENQDPGCFYGLQSKLVVQSQQNPRQRSVLVPMGNFKFRKYGEHVMTEVQNPGSYATYSINNILGRLECPAEPQLLYLKALFHALTSFVLPDPLTSRTGREEALACLESGQYQPWDPLNESHLLTLRRIADLSPARDFYPTGLRFMETTSFNPMLPTSIQDDRYRLVVERIVTISDKLSMFSSSEKPTVDLKATNEYLESRALARFRVYHQESSVPPATGQLSEDRLYRSRDRWRGLESNHVRQCTAIFRDWSSSVPFPSNLARLLQDHASTIGGFTRAFDKNSPSDLLDIDLIPEFGALANLCLQSTADDRFALAVLFGTLSFRENPKIDLLRAFAAYAIIPTVKALDPPKSPSFTKFVYFFTPTVDDLIRIIRVAKVPYRSDKRRDDRSSSSDPRKRLRLQEEHDVQAEEHCRELAKFLLQQWGRPLPCLDGFVQDEVLLDVDKAMDLLPPVWTRWVSNFEFSEYLHKVQPILDLHRSEKPRNVVLPSSASQAAVGTPRRKQTQFLQDLMKYEVSELDPGHSKMHGQTIVGPVLSKLPNGAPQKAMESADKKVAGSTSETAELRGIVSTLEASESIVFRDYGNSLLQSIKAYENTTPSADKQGHLNPTELSIQIRKAETEFREMFRELTKMLLELGGHKAEWLDIGGSFPRLTVVTLLQQLGSANVRLAPLGKNMKKNLVRLGVKVTALQRLLRMQDALHKSRTEQFRSELDNVGHTNWMPKDHLDWLLLEIESNCLFRPEQILVANEIISPSSGKNSVLQLLMGKGKTSCILPMAAAVLANSKQLFRAVIPRPLLLQTAQLLQARLGNHLLNREVRHIPFSRKTSTDNNVIKTYYHLHRDIRKKGGIILALPEHLLSFRLSGLQRLCDNRIEEATLMVNIQAWLDRHARDCLDECDVCLAPRTQLIYPSGDLSIVDGNPDRWLVIESVLAMVKDHIRNIQSKYPQSVEVVERENTFPFIFFLRRDAEEDLVSRLANDISNGRTTILPARSLPKSDRQAIYEYISSPKVSVDAVSSVNALFPDMPQKKKVMYLLRGLFVHRILMTCLRKRWGVQYGLSEVRDPLAVPYHAKGVPSSTAEWGHPDVALTLTILSFYYAGLSLAQVREALEHVLKSDDPIAEYERFGTSTLPHNLRDWNCINIQDEAQISEIHRYVKLQASGWDLVTFSPSGKFDQAGLPNMCRTTGFSGTLDGRTMLPLSISQRDLAPLAGTNAEVLAYLLQKRNRGYHIMTDSSGRRLSELGLLEKLQKMGIKILIDAGAQILEHQNQSFAKAWLGVDFKAPAVVYFDNDNRAWVLHRKSSLRTPLLATPYAENLQDCLVYLDEAHTRGTDLKFPPNARAGLTLGINLSKDALVQAAMRLRQLGTTQSVSFLAPVEVHQSILDVRGKRYDDSIDSKDVLCWLIQQTCTQIEAFQPLFYSQGIGFCDRAQAALDNPDFLSNPESRSRYLAVLRAREQQSLRMYEPKPSRPAPSASSYSTAWLHGFVKELNHRRKYFQDTTGSAVAGTALEEVEQEREVAFEVESVREVQKPTFYTPHTFPGLHRDIISFVSSGTLTPRSAAYEGAFSALRRTVLDQKYGINTNAVSLRLYISTEFMRTVRVTSANDDFFRPIHWILLNTITDRAMVIIPEEADFLIPILRERSPSGTHLLLYAAPITRRMLSYFSGYDFYAIPSLPPDFRAPTWLRIEASLLAGSLYFDFDLYPHLKVFYGVDDSNVVENDGSDAMDISAGSEASGQRAVITFTKKPLGFLHAWLAVRRKGHFEHTPMGHLAQGKPLDASNPFFTPPEDHVATKAKISVHQSSSPAKEEESDEDYYSEDEFFDTTEEQDGVHGDVYVDEDIDGDEDDNPLFAPIKDEE